MVLKYRSTITKLEPSHKPYLITKDSWMETESFQKNLGWTEISFQAGDIHSVGSCDAGSEVRITANNPTIKMPDNMYLLM